ncbi:D-amino acid oxidase [Saxophila tyrrhenica]|uniref:D-amino acid oxidase n=1 Tax=Saxophila tyrrhenica TaxID=1690608 RepID=A0AAV9PCQ3_9PEZI|nr:D-amino acid oxidase [Saxophila tyrrhenica]
MQQKNVVVLGAGVSGLTTALLLCKTRKYSITIIAKHMPGDYDIEYASPWAGADFVPPHVGMGVSMKEPLELATWPELERLAREQPEAGIHLQESIFYRRTKDRDNEKGKYVEDLMRDDNPFRRMLPNFRILHRNKLPQGMDAAVSYTSVCINTSLYLPWLASQCLKAGVVMKRGILNHISDAAALHHSSSPAELVVNCTGLSSLRLGGVEDLTLYPSRGQTAIVRNEPGVIMASTGTDEETESTYIMDRAAGGGCVLGGCSVKNSWDSQPDPNLAIRIMKRAVELCPSLVPPGQGIEALSVVRHAVGLRPMRKDGIRIEKETVRHPDRRPVTVVHNYGHGGAGYQTSYGAAKKAVALVEDRWTTQARL